MIIVRGILEDTPTLSRLVLVFITYYDDRWHSIETSLVWKDRNWRLEGRIHFRVSTKRAKFKDWITFGSTYQMVDPIFRLVTSQDGQFHICRCNNEDEKIDHRCATIMTILGMTLGTAATVGNRDYFGTFFTRFQGCLGELMQDLRKKEGFAN